MEIDQVGFSIPVGKNLHVSPTHQKLMESIMRVQLAVGVIEKGKLNPHFKSQYAPLDAIWSRATKVCASEGIVITQPATGHGVWTYIVHAPSGEWMASYMELPLVAPPVKNKETGEYQPGPITPQVIGSITSYARRYAYLAALGLVAGEEDDDGNVSSGLPETKAEQKVDPKEALRARKTAALDAIEKWLAVTVEKHGKKMTPSTMLEALGDILGRPMDNLTLRDENELVCLEEWVKNLQMDSNEAKASTTQKGK